MIATADLLRGERGEAVRDLQRRLGALGYTTSDDAPGTFGGATERAVRQFQDARGLRVDGVCGRQTWSSLVESGFALGDRLLYERRPMVRGDDVAELQRRLNTLGFDAGREDGILGPETAGALREFQRNAGLSADGIGGPETLDALRRLGSFAAGSVASVREREQLRNPGRLRGRRIYLAVSPGVEALGRIISRRLAGAGALAVVDLAAADPSANAAHANRFAAELFLGIRPGDRPGARCFYFATATFRSETGRRVAECVQRAVLAHLPGDPDDVLGKTFAVLRETRMAAVVCEPAGDPAGMRQLVGRAPEVAAAIVSGVRRAVEEPLDETPPSGRALTDR